MKIKKILVPTDFSDGARVAFDLALVTAAEHGAEIHLLHVVTLLGDDPNTAGDDLPEIEVLVKTLENRAVSSLRLLIESADVGSVEIKFHTVRAIAAAPAIIDYTQEEEIDLTILGTHGRRGLRRFLLGSVTDEVVRTLNGSVITVGGQAEVGANGFQQIAVPYDFSPDSDHALDIAIELARVSDGEIELVHVFVSPVPYASVGGVGVMVPDQQGLVAGCRERLESMAEQRASETGVEIRATVLESYSEAALVGYIDDVNVDLIVIGSRGVTGIWRLVLGSVTEKVIRTAEAPVWVARKGTDSECLRR